MDSVLSGSLVSFSGNPEVEKVRHRKRVRDGEETGIATAKGQKCHREAGWMWKEGSGCHRVTAGWESVEVMCYPLQLSGRRCGCLVYSGSGIFHLPSLFVVI